MNLPSFIRTGRLVLRPPRVSDARAIYDSYARDEEVTRFLRWRPHRAVAETEEFLRGVVDNQDDGSRRTWVITLGDVEDTLCGMIELTGRDFKAEAGYVLARPFWGRGLMTEALRAVLEEAFRDPSLFRVSAVCDVENRGSARVLEKSGMSFEGVLRRHVLHPNLGPEPRDARCYARVR